MPTFAKSRPIIITSYQSHWPAEFTQIATHLRQSVGNAALRIDHIGSTAVPDLPAKDIIDIQITVATLDDPAITQKLTAAGYQVRPDISRDSFVTISDPDSPDLQKRYARERQGERRTHIHIRENGRFNQQYPLLFRDYLRATPAARQAYARIKERLAALYPDSIDGYLYIKDPVMDLIFAAAQTWRQATAWQPDPAQNLEVLHTLTATLHQAADVEAIQASVLEAITLELGYPQAVMGLVDEAEESISSWLGKTNPAATPPQTITHTARLPLTPAGGLAATALLEGRVCRAEDQPCTTDGWLNSHFKMQNCLIIPLRWGIHPIGILLINTSNLPTTPTQQRLLEAIAQQTAVTIGMMQTRLRRAQASAIQAERGRIALDMHDAISQSLFGIVFTLDGSLKLLDSDPQAVRPELESALQTAESVRQDIRRTIHELWAEKLTPDTFSTQLRRYAEDVLHSNTLLIQFDIRGEFEQLTPKTRRHLYRLAQECLTNVVQHAAATESRVCMDIEVGRARLVVRDNGRGFEPDVALEQERGREHFGLRTMQERADTLGGTCDIFSQPGAGTSIVIDIPTHHHEPAHV